MIKAKLEYLNGNYNFLNNCVVNFVGDETVTANLDTLFCDYLNVAERVLVEKMRYIANEKKTNKERIRTLCNTLAYIHARKNSGKRFRFERWNKSSDAQIAKDIKKEIEAINDKNALLKVELDAINTQLSSISHTDSENEINKRVLKNFGFVLTGKIQKDDSSKYVFEFNGDEQELNATVLKKVEVLKKKVKTELQKFVENRTENKGTTK